MVKTRNNYNGIINVHKEAGYTSFDVVARLRGITGQRKIGHTGTLDPDATGVLPVVLGSATRLVDMMTDKEKEYHVTFMLGKTTDTQDISGSVLSESPVCCDRDEIIAAIDSFRGDILQIPPMYSALKVDGKRLYELAREGKTVERKARPVTIKDINITRIDIPEIEMTVRCSKGTYIRTLCHDIGSKLGCGAVMIKLVRTASGQFDLKSALTLGEIEQIRDEGRLSEVIIPVDALLPEYAEVSLEGELLRLALNGNMLKGKDLLKFKTSEGSVDKLRVYDDKGMFFALFMVTDRGYYKVDKMFLNE